MDVDPEIQQQQDESLRSSDTFELRPPPTFTNVSFDGSSLHLGSSESPTESLQSTQDFMTMKATLEVRLKQMQRQFQELKNLSRVTAQKSDAAYNETNNVKKLATKLETKLGPLQKMVASQTDKNMAMKKEITDLDKFSKGSTNEVNRKIDELQRDITDLKNKLEALERKVDSNSRFPGGGGGGGHVPDNLMQMIDAFERQLGMYDVRIAEMDLRFQVLENTSYTGTLVWKIREYARRKRDAVAGKTLSLYSQPFYTSRYGYKMCARIYLNGDGMGKGTHMSLFFVVMKGEYDALLPWPFRQKVTLVLLDQGAERKHLTDTFRPDPSSSSFKRPSSDMNIASGCPLFVAHNVIDNSSYIREDTIYVRIQVDTSDLENF